MFLASILSFKTSGINTESLFFIPGCGSVNLFKFNLMLLYNKMSRSSVRGAFLKLRILPNFFPYTKENSKVPSVKNRLRLPLSCYKTTADPDIQTEDFYK
jgi:hypothetical protein